ncbi:MAG: hypothetical protein QOE93_2216 [Actinomycetota bacterium]|nr:hypothetical protein [Actinomycetota bacterium]
MIRTRALRWWTAFDVALWVPLGTSAAAIVALQRTIDAHRADGEARSGAIADVGVALRLLPSLGGESQRAQRVAEPVMVFVVMPAFLVATGVAVGGVAGAVAAAAPLVALWVLLYRRVAAAAGRRPPVEVVADRDRVGTLPNAITCCRMLALGFFPVVLAAGNLEALLFLATMNCSDWADGFVARRYQAESKVGMMLDPATDRLMIIVVVVSMMAADLISPVLGGGVLVRELATVVLGVTLFRPRADGVPRATVRGAGRIGFALLNLGLVGLLASPPDGLRWAAEAGVAVGLVLSFYALVQYVADARVAVPGS